MAGSLRCKANLRDLPGSSFSYRWVSRRQRRFRASDNGTHVNGGATHGGGSDVDDDRQMCQLLLADVLGEEGHRTETVHDAAVRAGEVSRAGCDLMITDLMMPRMRGTELVKEVKAIDPDAVILLITGVRQHRKRGGGHASGGISLSDQTVSHR